MRYPVWTGTILALQEIVVPVSVAMAAPTCGSGSVRRNRYGL